MRYSRKIGPPIVSAAVATLVLTNFATVSIVIGEPFHVPADADDQAIETYRRQLEDRLKALEPRAQALLRGTT